MKTAKIRRSIYINAIPSEFNYAETCKFVKFLPLQSRKKNACKKKLQRKVFRTTISNLLFGD